MEDPRNLPAPEQLSDRVIALARDLVYGFAIGDWSPEFTVNRTVGVSTGREQWMSRGTDFHKQYLSDYLIQKWGGADHSTLPLASSLEVFGYFQRTGEVHFVESSVTSSYESVPYILTPKAIALLEEPAVPPTIFISYARKQSSAFALLIEARLAERGAKAFLDRQIEGGADWEQLIYSTITQRISHFIAVIAPDTLSGINVQNEIRWALQTNVHIIPIWHGGFTGKSPELEQYDDDIQRFVTQKNALRIIEESAASYDSALAQLLNQLEFAAPATRRTS